MEFRVNLTVLGSGDRKITLNAFLIVPCGTDKWNSEKEHETTKKKLRHSHRFNIKTQQVKHSR
jgi:hypothetical protein